VKKDDGIHDDDSSTGPQQYPPPSHQYHQALGSQQYPPPSHQYHQALGPQQHPRPPDHQPLNHFQFDSQLFIAKPLSLAHETAPVPDYTCQQWLALQGWPSVSQGSSDFVTDVPPIVIGHNVHPYVLSSLQCLLNVRSVPQSSSTTSLLHITTVCLPLLCFFPRFRNPSLEFPRK